MQGRDLMGGLETQPLDISFDSRRFRMLFQSFKIIRPSFSNNEEFR
jgi:hypothetical protein